MLDELIPRELIDPGPSLLLRCAHGLPDKVKLHNLVVSLKDGSSSEQLDHDAPSTPHVDFWSVGGRPKDEFRRTIPKGDHAVRVVPFGLFLEQSCQPEISQLQLTQLVHEKVGAYNWHMNSRRGDGIRVTFTYGL